MNMIKSFLIPFFSDFFKVLRSRYINYKMIWSAPSNVCLVVKYDVRWTSEKMSLTLKFLKFYKRLMESLYPSPKQKQKS